MTSVKKFWTAILAIIALVIIGYIQLNSEEQLVVNYHSEEPTFKSKQMVTFAYEPTGQLAYKLTAEEVENFAEQKSTWFTQPVLVIYDKTKAATWTVRSDKAKLTNNRQLYLYDNIVIDNLQVAPQIKQILAQEAFLNMLTQDITSDKQVTIIGPTFQSKGEKMKGNLKEKSAKLLDKVQTIYLPQAHN